ESDGDAEQYDAFDSACDEDWDPEQKDANAPKVARIWLAMKLSISFGAESYRATVGLPDTLLEHLGNCLTLYADWGHVADLLLREFEPEYVEMAGPYERQTDQW